MEAVMTTLLEGPLKYRQGRKWKPRWCVIKKPSPVADKVFVLLYKNRRDRCKLNHPKLTFSLEGYYGIESGLLFDKERYALSVICENVSLFAFQSREDMVQFEIRVRASFGEDSQYPVRLCKVPPLSKLPVNEVARLHIHSQRLCVTAYMPPKVLVSWNVCDLVKFGPIEGRFVLEGSASCGKGGGVFMFLTPSGDEIMNLLLRSRPLKSNSAITRRKSQASSELEPDFVRNINDISNSEDCISNRCYKRHSVCVTDYQKTVSMCQKYSRRKSHEKSEHATYDIPPSLIRPFLNKCIQESNTKLRNDLSNSIGNLHYVSFSKSSEQLCNFNNDNCEKYEVKNRQNNNLKFASSMESLLEEINKIYDRKTECNYAKNDIELDSQLDDEEVKILEDGNEILVSNGGNCHLITQKMNKTLQNVLHKIEIDCASVMGNSRTSNECGKSNDVNLKNVSDKSQGDADVKDIYSPHVVSKIENIPSSSKLSMPLPLINFKVLDEGDSPYTNCSASFRRKYDESESTLDKRLDFSQSKTQSDYINVRPVPPAIPPKSRDEIPPKVPERAALKMHLPPQLPPRRPKHNPVSGNASPSMARCQSQTAMYNNKRDAYIFMRSNSIPTHCGPTLHENLGQYIDMAPPAAQPNCIPANERISSKLDDIDRRYAESLGDKSQDPNDSYIDMTILSTLSTEHLANVTDCEADSSSTSSKPHLDGVTGNIKMRKSHSVVPFPDILTFLEYRNGQQKQFLSDSSLNVERTSNSCNASSLKTSPKSGLLSRFIRWNSRDKKNKDNNEITPDKISPCNASSDKPTNFDECDGLSDISNSSSILNVNNDRYKQRSSSFPNEASYKQNIQNEDRLLLLGKDGASGSVIDIIDENNEFAKTVYSSDLELYNCDPQINEMEDISPVEICTESKANCSQKDYERWQDLCVESIGENLDSVSDSSPLDQATAIAKHVGSLIPFIPPKIKIYTKDLSPVLENTPFSSGKVDADFYLSDSYEFVNEPGCRKKSSPATMKKKARAMLRISAAVEDEEGNIWVQRQNTSDECSGEAMSTGSHQNNTISDIREHMDSLSVSSHGTGSGSETYSCRGDDVVLRSSPASTVLRPRSGKEYRQIERRLLFDSFSHGSSPVTPQSPASVSSSVFTFDQRSTHSAYTCRDETSSTSTTKSPLVRRSYTLPHSYVNIGKTRGPESSSSSPYVNVTPPNSPRSCMSLEQVEPILNYVEIDMSQRSTNGNARQRLSRRLTTPKSAAIEYAKIDLVATEAVNRASKQHAQSREDSLRLNNYKTTLHKDIKRSVSARDRKTSSTSGDSSEI